MPLGEVEVNKAALEREWAATAAGAKGRRGVRATTVAATSLSRRRGGEVSVRAGGAAARGARKAPRGRVCGRKCLKRSGRVRRRCASLLWLCALHGHVVLL